MGIESRKEKDEYWINLSKAVIPIKLTDDKSPISYESISVNYSNNSLSTLGFQLIVNPFHLRSYIISFEGIFGQINSSNIFGNLNIGFGFGVKYEFEKFNWLMLINYGRINFRKTETEINFSKDIIYLSSSFRYYFTDTLPYFLTLNLAYNLKDIEIYKNKVQRYISIGIGSSL